MLGIASTQFFIELNLVCKMCVTQLTKLITKI